VRKYLNYIIFAGVILIVVGLAVSHSRHTRYLIDQLVSDDKQAHAAAATELIKDEQFGDAITGEPNETRVKIAAALEDLPTAAGVKQAMALFKDPDKGVRDRAILSLKRIGGKSPATITETINGLKDGDTNVRKGTIAALTGTREAIGPLPAVLDAIYAIMKKEAGARDAGGDVLSSALFNTGTARDVSVAELTKMLGDTNDIAIGAANALGKIGDVRAVEPLIALMHKSALKVRSTCISALALIPDKSTEAPLTEALMNPEDDNEARSGAASGLGKIGTPTAITTLLKTLDDPDNKLRSAAVSALSRAGESSEGRTPDPAVITQLVGALSDPNENVRLGVTQAMQSIHTTEANAALVSALQKDTTQIRIAAAAALGFEHNTAAIMPLISALDDPTGEVNAAATDALSAIGLSATQSLLAVTQKGGTDALFAAQALGKLGGRDKAAFAALQQSADSSDTTTQRWAAVALGATGLADAVPALKKLEASSDADVAYVAREQLTTLGVQQ